MDTAALIGVATLLVAVLGWAGFTPNGPHLVTRLWARIQAPRKEREELRKRVDALSALVDVVVDTSRSLMRSDIDNVKWDIEQQRELWSEVRKWRDIAYADSKTLEDLGPRVDALNEQLDQIATDTSHLLVCVLALAKRVEAESTVTYSPDVLGAFEQLQTMLASSPLMPGE
jgi:hypothetical protein